MCNQRNLQTARNVESDPLDATCTLEEHTRRPSATPDEGDASLRPEDGVLNFAHVTVHSILVLSSSSLYCHGSLTFFYQHGIENDEHAR